MAKDDHCSSSCVHALRAQIEGTGMRLKVRRRRYAPHRGRVQRTVLHRRHSQLGKRRQLFRELAAVPLEVHT